MADNIITRCLTQTSSTLSASQVEDQIVDAAEILVSNATRRSRQYASRLLGARQWDTKAVLRQFSEGCGSLAFSSRACCSCPHCSLLRDANLNTVAVSNDKCDVCLDSFDESESDSIELECGHRMHRQCLEQYVGSWLAKTTYSQVEIMHACPNCPINRCTFPVSVALQNGVLWNEQFLNREDVLQGWRCAANEFASTTITIGSKQYRAGDKEGILFLWPGITTESMWELYCALRNKRVQLLGDGPRSEFRPCVNEHCGAMVKLLETQPGDAVCDRCQARFCLFCRGRHHEPIPCPLIRAWNHFLNTRLSSSGGVRLRDLATENGRKLALEQVGREEALGILTQLNDHMSQVLAWPDADSAPPDSGPSAAEFVAVLDGISALLPRVALREEPLATQWRLFRAACSAVEAALSPAETEARLLTEELRAASLRLSGQLPAGIGAAAGPRRYVPDLAQLPVAGGGYGGGAGAFGAARPG